MRVLHETGAEIRDRIAALVPAVLATGDVTGVSDALEGTIAVPYVGTLIDAGDASERLTVVNRAKRLTMSISLIVVAESVFSVEQARSDAESVTEDVIEVIDGWKPTVCRVALELDRFDFVQEHAGRVAYEIQFETQADILTTPVP